jgi:hypothetical protein
MHLLFTKTRHNSDEALPVRRLRACPHLTGHAAPPTNVINSGSAAASTTAATG